MDDIFDEGSQIIMMENLVDYQKFWLVVELLKNSVKFFWIETL